MLSAASAARARSHCTRCAGRRETVGPGARTPTLAAHSRLALVERGAVSHRRLRPLIAASLLVLIVPAAASAAPAGDVSIRVEGSTATLAGPAVVRTVDGAFTKAAAAFYVGALFLLVGASALRRKDKGFWTIGGLAVSALLIAITAFSGPSAHLGR